MKSSELVPDTYAGVYRASMAHPEKFWLDAAQLIDWDSAPVEVLDDSQAPRYRWFPDARLNTCFNALDRHVQAGYGSQAALIFDSAMTSVKVTYTYSQLLDAVALFAGALRKRGVVAGDRVLIYMPMIPEAVIAMLACARIGAVHSVVFGGFAANELAKRIDDAEPVAIVTASGGLEPSRPVEYLPILDAALTISGVDVPNVIVKLRPGFDAKIADYDGGATAWLDWDEVVNDVAPADPVSLAATDPLYILYTSGTTAAPKGVVRDNGGHAVALAWTMRNLYNIRRGQVWWAASDVGWVVGHSYIVYGPLLAGATTVMYEGKPVGTPDAGAFWRIISEYQVAALFTAPTAVRAIRKVDPTASELAKYDVSSLQTLFLAGERLDPDTYQWATEVLGRPVVDHWWQTETGWAICANLRGLAPMAIKPGSPSTPCPGYGVAVVDETGRPVEAGAEGNIVIRLPLPPGTLTGLWRNDERYAKSYLSVFPGYYSTGDSGYIDEDGYLFVMGRSDDVINVAGHRLSTGAMETALAAHPAVAECAVIGIPDELKGQRPSGYVVLKSGTVIDPETLKKELITSVRARIGAVASFHDVTVVPALPKTRSGKILRKTMRELVSDEETIVPSTIEDASVLEDLRQQLRTAGQR
ncbi:propionyl-CoA synthetase [Paenarthrobacter sp. NPDC058040]|uniref:propionyl-CoA synthetase n=1 Tax=unclassified Paenarthrobacter TaxID=2634190 RepID=UPI0036D8EDF8